MANKNKCIQGHFTDEEHNGKNCPYDNMSIKELSEELKIKLDNKPKYIDKKLKDHYDWAVKNGFVSPLISFEDYKNIADGLDNIAIGKIAKDGTKIKEITNHCIDRVCGTTEKENGVKHEGIPLEDFKETLFNGIVRKGTGKSQNKIYIIDKCIITIDYKMGAIIQCNKTK